MHVQRQWGKEQAAEAAVAVFVTTTSQVNLERNPTLITISSGIQWQLGRELAEPNCLSALGGEHGGLGISICTFRYWQVVVEGRRCTDQHHTGTQLLSGDASQSAKCQQVCFVCVVLTEAATDPTHPGPHQYLLVPKSKDNRLFPFSFAL